MPQTTFESTAGDDELLRLVKTEPESLDARRAACELLTRYRDRIYAWCYRRLGNAEEALDATQEILLRVHQNLAGYEPHGLFSTWIYAITRNYCISRQRKARLFVDAVDPDLLRHPGPDPVQALADKMSEDQILAAIQSSLDELERQALWLRCFEQMPVERITEVLRIDQASGARGILQRARRKLREALIRTETVGRFRDENAVS